MFSIDKRIEIDSQPEAVFSFLDDPRNHVKITPGLIDVSDVEALPNGGKRAEYRYKLAGVTLVGSVEDVERSPASRLTQELSGAIDGTITYELDGGETGTLLRYEAAYDIPDTVIDTVLAPVASAYNRREAQTTLANLKTFLEN